MQRIIIALILVCTGALAVSAKCGPVLLRIKGQTTGHSENSKVLVTLTPDPKSSPPMVLLDGNRFEADVYYDPFKSYSKLFGYNCTKAPQRVTVALLENGKEVDKKELVFNRDFVADQDGGYILRRTLHLGK
jgi:hypothetical protein